MKILITGGAGYIGSHTCLELLKSSFDIVVVDNLSNSSIESIKRVRELTGKNFSFYKTDVCNKTELNKIFKKHKIDCVMHFSGFKSVGESVTCPLKYYNNNINATLTLCDCMLSNNVNNIVFSSSATVYSMDNKMPVSEDARLGCTNPYGWTKFMCERILKDFAKANNNWSVILLRYFNPVGAHESGMIGEDPKGIPNNLMPYISQTAIGKLEKLSVFGNHYATNDGTGVRDYIHVVDLAKGHVAAVNYISSFKGTEAFNLGTGKGYSVLEMIDKFCAVNGVNVPYIISEPREGDIPVCFANPEKAKRLLNWSAQKGLEEMCKDTWNWQCKNPDGYR